MKKIIKNLLFTAVIGIAAAGSTQMVAQTTITGAAAEKMVGGAQLIRMNDNSKIPAYLQFRAGSELDFSTFDRWFHSTFKVDNTIGLKLLNTENDKLGMVHYRYQQTIGGLAVESTMLIVHTKNGKVVSFNGVGFDKFTGAGTAAGMTEDAALVVALRYMNATEYRWQSAAYEAQIKTITKNADATWFPAGELVYAAVKGMVSDSNYRLVYKFDIYASKPLKRDYVYVDAVSGDVILDQNRIMDVNTPAIAYTVYSGHRHIMTDSNGGGYRLEETGRGQGCSIMTYNNLKNPNPTGTVDFTNTTTTWHVVNSALDQYATDAHWGAEKTYDFYDTVFGRNSIDNAGLALLSFVHTDVNLVNAFWDGQEMNYGDGDSTQGYTPLTSMDVTGHEITHGLTQYTSNLNGGAGTQEPGAINEGNSDVFGITIRHFAKQSTTIDWLIGDSIGTNVPFRDVANPPNTSNPTTYLGTNWDAANQEVHQNSTIYSHCYYLVCMGGSGTNDNSNVYNVTGIGMNEAREIWYRANTVYFSPTTQYTDARTYCIQAAVDLFGGCSPEVIATTNAWYAVGVGAAFVAGPPVVGFTAIPTSSCSLPASVTFTNTTTNGGAYVWHFGDNTTSAAQNPTHTYTTAGTFTVKLATSGACGNDSTTQTNLITINPPTAPTATSPITVTCGSTATLTASGTGTLNWYSSSSGGTVLGTGTSFTTPVINANTTYYVSSAIGQASDYDTPTDNTIGAGGNLNAAHAEIFDVLQPCTLVSVLVYATGAGNRTITLNNSTGTVLQTATINIPNGSSRITLNFPLTVGTGYQLAVGGTPNLYRNSAGASYPYNDANGLVSITGNDVPDPARYYYFYDWELAPASCTSAATPVNVVLNGGPVASFTYVQNSTTVTFTNTSSGSTTWVWNFGDGSATTTNQNTAHTYSSNGTYTVTLHSYNGVCNDSTTQIISITTVGITDYAAQTAMTLYPNPTNGSFTLELNTVQNEKAEVKVMNAIGQIIVDENHSFVSGKNLLPIDMTAIAKGVYFVQLKTSATIITKRIVLE